MIEDINILFTIYNKLNGRFPTKLILGQETVRQLNAMTYIGAPEGKSGVDLLNEKLPFDSVIVTDDDYYLWVAP